MWTGFLMITIDGSVTFAQVAYRTPPRAVSAQFAPDGSSIDVMYDQSTNARSLRLSCQDLFTASALAMLGSQPKCVWDDGTKMALIGNIRVNLGGQIVSIVLGSGSTIGIGHALTVVAGAVKSFNGMSAGNSEASLSVAAPKVLAAPK